MEEEELEFPVLDERIERIGLSTLQRKLRRETFRNLKYQRHLLVVQDNGHPVAVIVSYEGFLALQRALEVGATFISAASLPDLDPAPATAPD